MSGGGCETCTPPGGGLFQEGTTQRQRLDPALDPTHAPLEDRDLAQLLVWVQRYAQELLFYSPTDHASQDWSRLVGRDVSAVVAMIQTTRTDPLHREAAARVAAIGTTGTQAGRLERLVHAARAALSLSQQIEGWRRQTEPTLLLRRTIDEVIQTEAAPAMSWLLAIAQAVEQVEGFGPAGELAVEIQRLEWPLTPGSLSDLAWSGATFPDRVRGAVGRLLEVHRQLELAVHRILAQAPAALRQTLESWPDHAPHMALLITFLELYLRYPAAALNDLVRRHLDFAYARVLQVPLRPAAAPIAHLTFTLRRNAAPHKLAEGSRLVAGKDGRGKPVHFVLDEAFVVSRASVARSMALRVERAPGELIYSVAPSADSANGHGAAFPEGVEPRWSPFAAAPNLALLATSPFDPPGPAAASVGLAIASPLLHLAEGGRRLTLTLSLRSDRVGRALRATGAAQALREQVRLQPGEAKRALAAFDALAGTTNLSTMGDVLEPLVELLARVSRAVALLRALVHEAGGGAREPAVARARAVADALEARSRLVRVELSALVLYARDWKAAPAAREQVFHALLRHIWAPVDPPHLDAAVLKSASSTQRLQRGRAALVGIARSVDEGADVAGELLALVPDAPPTLPWVSVLLSTAEGWVERATRLLGGSSASAVVEIELGPKDPAIVPPPLQGPADLPASTLPVLAFRASPQAAALLEGEQLLAIDLEVQVDQVRQLVLQTDAGPVKPGKPFLPFGPVPRVGASLMVGSWEVFQKRLDHLEIALSWSDDLSTIFPKNPGPVPARASLGSDSSPVTYAQIYDPISIDQFQGRVERLDGGSWVEVEAATSLRGAIPIEDPGFSDSAAGLPAFERYGIELDRGFLRLRLSTDLQHARYPTLLATAAIQNKAELLPAPPWTPRLEGISLNYSASERYQPGQAGEGFELFHLLPFGVRPLAGDPKPTPLPELRVGPASRAEPEPDRLAGALYLGLDGVEPGEQLSLLFQVADGSADPLAPRHPPLTWCYLAGEDWLRLPATRLLEEGTDGLQRSGLVRIALPAAADRIHRSMPTGLCWLRVGIGTSDDPRSVCDLVGIHAQATRARMLDPGRHPAELLARSVPAGTIKQLSPREPAIKAVDQPYASFGGRPAEVRDAGWRLRVSERIRHKDRAIAPWDYERLVLEAFPEVYRVLCMQHTDHLGRHRPGAVTVVVVANVDNHNAIDPLRPRASVDTLARIQDHLRMRASPFLLRSPGGQPRLQVINPAWLPVEVQTRVRLRPGRPQGFCARQLNQDLRVRLAPWAFASGVDLSFGGRIPGSLLVDFIDGLDYIDAVLDFSLKVGDETRPLQEATTTLPHQILVSAATHRIEAELP